MPAMLRDTFKQFIALLLFLENDLKVSARLSEFRWLLGPERFAFIT
jgi:hypothetical protein